MPSSAAVKFSGVWPAANGSGGPTWPSGRRCCVRPAPAPDWCSASGHVWFLLFWWSRDHACALGYWNLALLPFLSFLTWSCATATLIVVQHHHA
jgi:hypothetical protein